jgi:hypothetical protein
MPASMFPINFFQKFSLSLRRTGHRNNMYNLMGLYMCLHVAFPVTNVFVYMMHMHNSMFVYTAHLISVVFVYIGCTYYFEGLSTYSKIK